METLRFYRSQMTVKYPLNQARKGSHALPFFAERILVKPYVGYGHARTVKENYRILRLDREGFFPYLIPIWPFVCIVNLFTFPGKGKTRSFIE